MLIVLIFSKYFYMASIGTYFTFYLIHKFQLSVPQAQIHLFIFLGAVAVGTLAGGPIGDRFGRKYVIWFSILGVLPFTLMLPYANLFWTGVLTVVIGLILSSAFAAILVYAQELVPGKVGTIAGLFFGFAFGLGGLGAASLGQLADITSIDFVYQVCSFLPAHRHAGGLPAESGNGDQPEAVRRRRSLLKSLSALQGEREASAIAKRWEGEVPSRSRHLTSHRYAGRLASLSPLKGGEG